MNSLMDNAIRLVGLLLCGFGAKLAVDLAVTNDLALALLGIPAAWPYCKVTLSSSNKPVSPLSVALALIPFLGLVLIAGQYGGPELALAVILNTLGALFFLLPTLSNRPDKS
ncbi:MAG: hypothetical protein HY986_02170 [Candidatus Melainabacteria bacterium]|nr:hypothetical protein [Candidatus Melainabacteria bacterium]